MTGFPGEVSSHLPLHTALHEKKKGKTMKKFLLAALPLCVFLCVFVSPAMALGQHTLPADSTPVIMVHVQSDRCQVLQEQLAQIRHLLRYSRAYPGDGASDPQVILTRNVTRASLLKQMIQVQANLEACSNRMTVSQCQALQGQLAQVSHLLQYSRVYLGDDSFDQQIVKTRISTRAILLKQLSLTQTKLHACLSSSTASA
jgi:hypothetical protein